MPNVTHSFILPSERFALLQKNPRHLVWDFYSQLKNIIISTYRSNRPVFGYSENMVKAGSVASYYTDMTDLAREVADILNILNSKDTPYREHSKYNKLTINVAVARSLNLNSLKSSL